MNKCPTASDDQLLRRESYIRRARYVALCGAVGGIAGFIGAATHVLSPDELYPGLAVALLCVLYGYSCSVRLRHIQSIKHYRGMFALNQ